MRRLGRLVAAACAAALVATACADTDTLDELRAPSSTTSSTTSLPVDTDGNDADAVDDPSSDGTDPIPAGIAPDPDPTPLVIDGDYRIGTLDNGLTYLLRSNDSPGFSLDLRLLVDAGSAQQAVPDDGSAHFLEHMLFNGTEKYPGNELSRALQQLGIDFGPELNAFTSYDETVYLLAATTIDPTAPGIAFDVLAEWAAAAVIDPDEVQREIGVVRDELRQSRETADGHLIDEFDRIYTAGTPYEGHQPIGEATKVEATTAETLRAYYETWYRPDNMAVVVVGDLPLDRLEEMVVEYFGGLERPTTPLEREPIVTNPSPEPVTEVVTHPGNAIDNISLDLPIPAWDRSTVGGDRLALMETMIAIMVENRLDDAFQRGELVLDNPPVLSEFSINRGLRYFGTNLQADDLEAALDGYLAELIGAAAGGFAEAELERVRSALLAALDDQEAALGAIQDWEYASDLMLWWLDSADLSDGRDRIARHRNLVADLTAEELTGHWRWLLESGGPIIVAVGADASTLPTAERLREILDEARPSAVGDSGRHIEALMERPAAVEPVNRDVTRTLNGDVHRWTFPNGVEVSFQESDIAEGFVEVSTAASGGWSTFPEGHPGGNAVAASFAVDAVLGGGLGAHDAATLRRFLESRAAAVSAGISDVEEGLSGSAARDDIEVLFQLIHLLVTDPRIDDVAYRTSRNRMEQVVAFHDSDVDFQAEEQLIALVTGGDTRFSSVPSAAQLDQLTPELLLDVFRARFGKVDDLHVAVVGDVDVDVIEALSSSYLATLPTGPADSGVDLGTEYPAGVHTAEVILPDGTADGGILVTHRVLTDVDASLQATAAVLETVINSRITDVIREELAASYGGHSLLSVGREPERLTSTITIDGDPARLDEIRTALQANLAELAVAGPSAGEFDRAASVIGDNWAFVDNPTFLRTNLDAGRFPDADLLTPDNRSVALGSVRPTDVRDLAFALYGSGDWVEVAKVLP